MSLNNFLSSLALSGAGGGNTLTALISAVVESFAPGYGLLASQVLQQQFSADAGTVLKVIAIGLVSITLIRGLFLKGREFYDCVVRMCTRYYSSAIHIDSDDVLFRATSAWVATQTATKEPRLIKASSKADYKTEDSQADVEVLDEFGIFNEEKIKVHYGPHFGTQRFTFKGRTFYFEKGATEDRDGGRTKRSEWIRLSCSGRSTVPVKELLDHIRTWYGNLNTNLTKVYRPGNEWDKFFWNTSELRPIRPVSTVSMDLDQKLKVVGDVNQYLHPSSYRWYAARGIPFRRGYLFHGPPGTGKTSLTLAIAGIFRLGIYCISLREEILTEAALATLFSMLPDRCIVLMEDIDATGICRKRAMGTDDDEAEDEDKSDEPPMRRRAGVTLSGLLNVIDGVGAREGRILIMTSNCPEKLDDALLRPGRVDMKVEFTNCSREQIVDMFTRMFSTDRDAQDSEPKRAPRLAKRSDEGNTQFRELLAQKQPHLTDIETVDAEKVAHMAEQFGDLVPEYQFSPAELQGYMLVRRHQPSKALADIEDWCAATLAEKARKQEARKQMLAKRKAAKEGKGK
jgi:chaperone BCS1